MKKTINNIKSNTDIKNRFVKYISIGVLIMLLFSLYGEISRLKEANLQIERENEKVEKLRKEKEELENSLEKARSEEFIEKQLRDNLGLAKDGEIIVILPDAETVKKFAPRMDDEEKLTLIPNWKKWLKLFL